jgi:hypothetical protein
VNRIAGHQPGRVHGEKRKELVRSGWSLGIVFQKDLGDKTAEIAPAMTQYDADDSWHPVEDKL